MKEIDCKKGDNVTVNIVKGNVTPGVAITTYASALINDLVELFDTINDKEWN